MTKLPETSSAGSTGMWFVHNDDQIIIRVWLSLLNGKEQIFANDALVVDKRNISSMNAYHSFSHRDDWYDVEVYGRDIMIGRFECNFFRNGQLVGAYATGTTKSLTSIVEPNTEVAPIIKRALARYRKEAECLLNRFDLKDAHLMLTKAIALDPKDGHSHFMLACVYSLQENTVLGLEHLAQALFHDLKGKARVLTDDRLAYLRIQPEFEDFKVKHLQ